jgi:hypothetical protein
MLSREQILLIADQRPIRLLTTPAQQKEQAKKKKESATAGPDWYDMPAPVMTPELRDDLRLLSLRSALDPSRHYKKGDKPVSSRFLQIGQYVSDPSSFYTDRRSRKQRMAPTIVDSLLRDVERKQYLKRKYSEIEHRNMRNGRKPSKAVKKPWRSKE